MPQVSLKWLEQPGGERSLAHGGRHQQANTGCSLQEKLNLSWHFPAKGETLALVLKD